jgi:Ni/Fe-hydrogenase subunit HybB-like protein
MGYAVVVFESAFSSMAFKRTPETGMLASLAAAIVPLQILVVLLRLADLAERGMITRLFAGDVRSMMVIIEFALFLVPAGMLLNARRRRDLGHLVRTAMVMIFGGALYRFDVYLVAFNPGPHWSYFPSVQELLVTTGLVAAEVIAYILIVRTFPILAGGRQLTPERQAA